MESMAKNAGTKVIFTNKSDNKNFDKNDIIEAMES